MVESVVDVKRILGDMDSLRVSQVLDILLSNALKFTAKGGEICVSVEFGMSSRAKSKGWIGGFSRRTARVTQEDATDGSADSRNDLVAHISVTDTGCGIEAVSENPFSRLLCIVLYSIVSCCIVFIMQRVQDSFTVLYRSFQLIFVCMLAPSPGPS